jgi:Xaa-Pro aminopeptidase
MKKISLFLLIWLALASPGFSQQPSTPQDYLSKEFHKDRREQLRKKLPPNSVAVLFANPVRNRANDVDFHYHQDPDFYYLTGYQEPNAVVLIFSEDQRDAQGTYNEAIYVQGHNERQEQWNGRRLGPKGVQEQLGFNRVYENTAFKEAQVQFPKFSKVLFFDFKNDIRDDRSESGDLYDLVKHFRQKAQIPADFSPQKAMVHDRIRNHAPEDREALVKWVSNAAKYYPELKEDAYIADFMKTASQPQGAASAREKKKMKGAIEPPTNNLDAQMLEGFMADLREIKTKEEVALLRKAVAISAIGQAEVMKAMHPGMSETEIQGIHEFVFKKYGAEYEGYPSIVGAGHNACVLHYVTNNKLKVGNDLVLMDLGAEYRGYTADVTRTIPASGKFTREQKAIYDLVYKAQEEAFKICKPGEPISKTTAICREVAAKGLIELGIIKDEKEVGRYFPHGVSHHIGLDVHDRGNYKNFEENMVLTVEPGIYIPENSPCDKKWWGIGVRIEDDILITKDGYELLSNQAPRKSEEIEKLMEQNSVLNQFVLPELE